MILVCRGIKGGGKTHVWKGNAGDGRNRVAHRDSLTRDNKVIRRLVHLIRLPSFLTKILLQTYKVKEWLEVLIA